MVAFSVLRGVSRDILPILHRVPLGPQLRSPPILWGCRGMTSSRASPYRRAGLFAQRRDILVECDFGFNLMDGSEAEAASLGFGTMKPPPGTCAPSSRWTRAELLEVAAVDSRSVVHGGRYRTQRRS